MTSSSLAVGLTGGIGSGKSLIANLFAARGAAIVDTDLIAHELTGPQGAAIPSIEAVFGKTFIDANGAMDRVRMRQEAFSNTQSKAALEAILHPLIRLEAEQRAAQSTAPYLLFVVPLLVESGTWRERVSRVLVIDCPEELQVRRVMQRNHWSAEQVQAVMAAQATRAERLAAADDVILNDGGLDTLEPQVDKLDALYRQLAGAASA